MGMPQLADLVQETANAPGTGAFTLGGAPAGRQTFADAFPAGGEVFYYASDGTQTEWGIGTLHVGSPNVLTRTTVLGNLFGSKTALNFSSAVMIWNEVPSGRMPFQDDAGQLPVSGNPDFTRDVALSAKAAEARYVKGVGGSNDYAPLSICVQKATGRMWVAYQNDSGAVVVALAATPADLSSVDAALSTAITKETTRAQAAESSKANLTGGNAFNGLQTFGVDSAFLGMGYQAAPTQGCLWGWNWGGSGTGETAWRNFRGGGLGGFSWWNGTDNTDQIKLMHLAADGTLATSRGALAFASQLPFSDTALRIQAFTASGTGEATVKFPTAFRVGTTPIVVPVINREPNAVSRFANIDNINSENNPNITNTGFTFQPVFVSGSAGTSTGQWTLQVIAIGYF